ncbi:MAG TPA: type II toxin-antitoxin system VapC family toxin [Acidimicrobiales bacterium]|nr:type II toxin-antitoxin system VapC family toxin [Acidimicrobiales bacterium]
MNLLLDTHALLWWLAGVELSDEAAAAIGDPDNLVAVSAATVWEASIKAALGKLELPEPIGTAIVEDGLEPLPITLEHAERVALLPPHHRDPFDRMLIAQAQVEGLVIVTRDPGFGAYDVTVLSC